MPHKDTGQRRAYHAAYYQKHRQEQLLAAHARYDDDPTAKQAYNRAYYALHQERERANAKQYGRLHRLERAVYHKRYWPIYYLAHKQEVTTRRQQYIDAHPEVRRMAKARYLARRKMLPATLTAAQWKAIKAAYHNRCAYCGQGQMPLEQEHVIPVNNGGGTTPDNIVPACRSCNAHKSFNPPLSLPAIRLLL